MVETSRSTDVLIVEDSATQSAKLQHLLDKSGYDTVVATNGRAALDAAREKHPKLIVSDVVMPEMDGYELCRRVKADPELRSIPVILLTSLADAVDVVKGLECGADNFITKPYEDRYLLSRIQYILINRELNNDDKMQLGIEIVFRGQKYFITSERQQILNLLLSTYEAAVQKNLELIRVQEELKHLNEHLEEEVRRRTLATQENFARLGALVENLHLGVLLESEQRLIVSINRKFSDMFALSSPAQWLGMSGSDLNHKIKTLFSEPDAFLQKNADAMQQNQPIVSDPVCTIDGRTLERDYIPIRVGSDNRGHLWLYRDVTERKKAEESLRHTEEQLRQAQKMEAVGQLAGGIAHDFNNLLTVILSYSDFILSEIKDDHPFYPEISQIRKAGERATGLTKQLLTFSRKQVVQPRVLDLNLLILNVEKMLQRIIGEDVELLSRLATNVGEIEADPGQLEQVLLNLAVNARDAMPKGGRLTVETANFELTENNEQLQMPVHPGSYVMLSVTDTGTGMTRETLDRIFEPFFTTKGEAKGTGLGLSTVYGIVKQSAGNICVQSEVGAGTTFKIYLPRVQPNSDLQATRDVARPSAEGSETILLVEDDSDVRTLSTVVLRQSGYKVIEAGSGKDALNVLRDYTGPVNLVVTDLVMPEMSGRELAERIKETRPDLTVLYVSGYTDDTFVRHGIFTAEVQFLPKPFTPQALISKVREILDRA